MDSIFPLNLLWQGMELLNLDNIKPLVMLHSNTCLSCSDGIGVKMYMYPDVRNAEFSGYFSHAWESGVTPEGFSASIAIRSMVNVERHFLHQTNTDRYDRWISVKIDLDNGYHIWAFFTSVLLAHPHRIILIHPDGSISRLKQDETQLLPQDVDKLSNTILKTPLFTLQWTIDEPIKFTRHSITMVGYGKVTGTYEHADITGCVMLEVPDMRPYDERAQEILREVFTESATKHEKHFSKAFFSTMPDVSTSIVVWLLPLLFGLFLLIMIFYLILHHKKKHPWKRAKTGIRNLFP
jgi:hypothetical protein